MAEHVEIINLTGRLREAVHSGDADVVRARVDEVAAALGPHTQAEEVGLFSVMAEQDTFTDHIATLCGEHGTLDGLLLAIADGDHSLIDTFETALRIHIDKEDNGLFPAAAIALDGSDWERVQANENSLHSHDHSHDHDHAHGHDHSHGHDHRHPH